MKQKTATRAGRPGIIWTKKMMNEFKRLYLKKSQHELAAHYGCTQAAINAMAQRLEVKKRGRGWTTKMDRELLAKWNTHTGDQLAAIFGKKRLAVIRRYNTLMNH